VFTRAIGSVLIREKVESLVDFGNVESLLVEVDLGHGIGKQSICFNFVALAVIDRALDICRSKLWFDGACGALEEALLKITQQC
jgi:hypothetical protein